MIHYASGNCFDRAADVRVNTVNCVGVMGKGIALEFKKRYPAMFADYARACRRGEVAPGRLHTYRVAVNYLIVNFPTKRHWRDPSRYEDIDAGLDALRDLLAPLGRVHVTLPALGCGNGGLDWNRVSQMIGFDLGALEAEIFVYQPQDSR